MSIIPQLQKVHSDIRQFYAVEDLRGLHTYLTELAKPETDVQVLKIALVVMKGAPLNEDLAKDMDAIRELFDAKDAALSAK